jgi:3-dehydroquinate synthase II
MDRIVWIRAPSREAPEDLERLARSAIEAGFDRIVVGSGAEWPRGLRRLSPILLKDDVLVAPDGEIGRLVPIRSAKDESAVRALRGRTKYVVVQMRDWKIIPLENLIAHFRGSNTRLLVEVGDVAEAKLALETMEVGADGILFPASSPEDIRALRRVIGSARSRIPLVRARVIALRPLALGDRVCVDTTSLLGSGEGLLVGNSASGLFLVHAETVESEYVAARPFRVNAGAVHAYVYLPDGRTRYLSELRTGDDVLAVDWEGRARPVVVGRVKIERRPLLLVEAEAQDRRYATIVQNAETIRFVTADGGAVSVKDLKEGDELLLRVDEGGRHLGLRIEETITER